MESLLKSYSDKTYSHAPLATHKGTVIAFAQDQNCQIYHAVFDHKGNYLDVECWPPDPIPLHFPTEIERVGYSLIGVTAMPQVKIGTQTEASLHLNTEDIDPFLSTTARLTAPACFRVYSDNKYIYVFRQSIYSHVGAWLSLHDVY